MKQLIVTIILMYIGISAHAETRRTYHDSIQTIADTTLLFDAAGNGTVMQAIEMRASLPDSKLGKPHDLFGILWDVSDDGKTYYSATLQPVSQHGDEIMDNRYILLTVSHKSPSGINQLHQLRLKDGFGMEKEANTLGVEINADSAHIIIYGGHQVPELIHEMKMTGTHTGRMGVTAVGKANVSLLVSEIATSEAEHLTTKWTPELIDSHLKTAGVEFPEGRYRYLDRENDPRYARPGGKYEIALVSNDDGGYDIIYLGGAETNAHLWKPGMIKGRLRPTIFNSHYDLEWVDASMTVTSDECSADIEQRAILRLNFPLLKSTLRFSFLPQDM